MHVLRLYPGVPSMMFQNWKSRITRKMKFAGGGNTQKKGANCQTNPIKKFFFCNPKARNHPDYPRWHAKAKGINDKRGV
jgi:hypothetical protein